MTASVESLYPGIRGISAQTVQKFAGQKAGFAKIIKRIEETSDKNEDPHPFYLFLSLVSNIQSL